MPRKPKSLTPGPRRADLTGRRFGRLVVRYLIEVKDRHGIWASDCDCGTQGFPARDTKLREGRVKSCGCYRADPAVRSAARLSIPPDERTRLAKIGH